MLFDSAGIIESVFLDVALAATGKSIVLYGSMIGATTFGCCLAVLVLGKSLESVLASMLRWRAARCWFASVLKHCSSNFCKGKSDCLDAPFSLRTMFHLRCRRLRGL